MRLSPSMGAKGTCRQTELGEVTSRSTTTRWAQRRALLEPPTTQTTARLSFPIWLPRESLTAKAMKNRSTLATNRLLKERASESLPTPRLPGSNLPVSTSSLPGRTATKSRRSEPPTRRACAPLKSASPRCPTSRGTPMSQNKSKRLCANFHLSIKSHQADLGQDRKWRREVSQKDR